jgi:hypothetical protein
VNVSFAYRWCWSLRGLGLAIARMTRAMAVEFAELVAFLIGPAAISFTGSNWICDNGLTTQ